MLQSTSEESSPLCFFVSTSTSVVFRKRVLVILQVETLLVIFFFLLFAATDAVSTTDEIHHHQDNNNNNNNNNANPPPPPPSLSSSSSLRRRRRRPPCSLNGDYITTENSTTSGGGSGSCICDKPWIGDQCELLDVLPIASGQPQGYGMLPNQTTWGGDIVMADDAYHLFVSTITNRRSLRHWSTHSRIEHAISRDNITGPYTFEDVALPTFSHNPKVISLSPPPSQSPHTSTAATTTSTITRTLLALFHIGSGTGPNEGDDDFSNEFFVDTISTTQSTIKRRRQQRRVEGEEEGTLQQLQNGGGGSSTKSRSRSRSSNIHIAESVYGPWIPLINSTLGSCNNPAPFVHHHHHQSSSTTNANIPSGIYIVCNHIELKRADQIWGPWTNVGLVVDVTSIRIGDKYEDPTLYIDHRGYHVIFHRYNGIENPPHGHDCTNSTISAHLFSKDGQTWYKSPGQPYNNHIPIIEATATTTTTTSSRRNRNNSSMLLVSTRERPAFVIGSQNPTADGSSTGRKLQLTHLITSVCSAENCPNERSYMGCVDCKYRSWDYTLIQPLNV